MVVVGCGEMGMVVLSYSCVHTTICLFRTMKEARTGLGVVGESTFGCYCGALLGVGRALEAPWYVGVSVDVMGSLS